MNSKTKNWVLILSFGLALFLCYKFAVLNTLNLRKEYKIYQLDIEQSDDISTQLSLLRKKQKHYDSILDHMNFGNSSFENSLLRIINSEANKRSLRVMDFNNPHVFESDQGTYYTYNFTLKGNFLDILRVIRNIEHEHNLGEIIHLFFEKRINYTTNKHFLEANILLQNVR